MKILFNYLTHGDETLGLKVSDALKKEYPELVNKQLFFSLANLKAYKQKKRYIDEDLNRVFPGKIDGNYEERLAVQIVKDIKRFDLVIDIHSTKSETKDTVIITKTNKLVAEAIRIIQPKYVLEMRVKSEGALISHSKAGIALEFGNNDDETVFKKTLNACQCVIGRFLTDKESEGLGFPTEYYKVTNQIEKPTGYLLRPEIKNFILVKKGEIYATAPNHPDLIAKEDFYPVIFGQTNYETIFGFAAMKNGSK